MMLFVVISQINQGIFFLCLKKKKKKKREGQKGKAPGGKRERGRPRASPSGP
jgi:hypothetical protein